MGGINVMGCAPAKQKPGELPPPEYSAGTTQNSSVRAKRFKIGDEVECNIGGGAWGRGSIVKVNVMDPEVNAHNGWPAGTMVPYAIRLRSTAKTIVAPDDADDIIRPVAPGAPPEEMPKPIANKKYQLGDKVAPQSHRTISDQVGYRWAFD